jgi:hypothetical protein
MIYLPIVAGGETRWLVGGVKYMLCSILILLFINMLIIGDQTWLSMKRLSLLKLFLFRCISVASFTGESTYPDVLLNVEVQLKLMQ